MTGSFLVMIGPSSIKAMALLMFVLLAALLCLAELLSKELVSEVEPKLQSWRKMAMYKDACNYCHEKDMLVHDATATANTIRQACSACRKQESEVAMSQVPVQCCGNSGTGTSSGADLATGNHGAPLQPHKRRLQSLSGKMWRCGVHPSLQQSVQWLERQVRMPLRCSDSSRQRHS